MTVTLRRDTQSFKKLQSFLLAHSNATSDRATLRDNELLWISRKAVRVAVAVTLELVPSSKSQLQDQLLQHADTRSLLQQTLQRNVVVCTEARVEISVLEHLVAKSRSVKDKEQKLMTFRVISTYPSGIFTRVTPDTRVTLTNPNGYGRTIEEDGASGDLACTIPDLQQHKEVEIGGMDDERAALRELILLPVVHPKLHSDMGVEFPKGVLLCGPPGVGKTLLVRSVVYECRQVKDTSGVMLDLKLQLINGSEIMTSGRGDAERALRATFEMAVAHARDAQHAASVIFVDELDALCPKRDAAGGGAMSAHNRIVAQLLTLLDGVESGLSRENVVVVAATNLPNLIDPAGSHDAESHDTGV
ncbi:unnamed protein product [Peronospora destructor]|uniref:AAA+ ATPase domain-containing protein n=1 Tax=Peronospora destructor TaxID=86335 RepID=A0AAV0UY73_9STRA|nr:unnamed protein product [Peronospora destructor]